MNLADHLDALARDAPGASLLHVDDEKNDAKLHACFLHWLAHPSIDAARVLVVGAFRHASHMARDSLLRAANNCGEHGKALRQALIEDGDFDRRLRSGELGVAMAALHPPHMCGMYECLVDALLKRQMYIAAASLYRRVTPYSPIAAIFAKRWQTMTDEQVVEELEVLRNTIDSVPRSNCLCGNVLYGVPPTGVCCEECGELILGDK